MIDGRPFGTTPQDIRLNNRLPAVQVILRKPGYLEMVREVDFTEPVTVINTNLTPEKIEEKIEELER